MAGAKDIEKMLRCYDIYPGKAGNCPFDTAEKGPRLKAAPFPRLMEEVYTNGTPIFNQQSPKFIKKTSDPNILPQPDLLHGTKIS